MAHASALTMPKKVKTLVRRAVGGFGRSLAKVGKAATKHKLSAPCSAALSRTLGDVQQRTQGIAGGL
jgi:hypothetical protein